MTMNVVSGPSAKGEAREWLLAYFSNPAHSTLSSVIRRSAVAAGISRSTLYRAAGELNVVSRGRTVACRWSLPQ